MAEASRTQVYDVDTEKLYNTIVDYETYPKFVAGVDSVKINKKNEQGAEVEYSLNLIKEFNYTLEMKHRPHTEVTWSLKSGDIFKKNNGSWILKNLGENKTEVTYKLELDFKLLVPKMMLNKLAASNLPSMMDKMVARAQERKK